MKIRKLRISDAPYMFEWMSDETVVKDLFTDFLSKTIDDCIFFIKNSDSMNSCNFAIANYKNEYMGTVSLKHIDTHNRTAEFAIAVRKKAMGSGYSWYGMKQIIEYAFEKKGLEHLYWCVSDSNDRAYKFYKKHNFHETNNVPREILSNYQGIKNLKWFCFEKNEFLRKKKRKKILNCKIINIKTVPTQGAGQLSFFESNVDFDFEIKRLYYIANVPEGRTRGYHAHKELKQFLFCPFGSVNLVLDNGTNRDEILLDNPSFGVLIDSPIWREITWIQKDSVLCVAASDYYKQDDYIRDYSDYQEYIKSRI